MLLGFSQPGVMDRYNALALDYLAKADEAKITGPMPPPGFPSRHGRRGADHD